MSDDISPAQAIKEAEKRGCTVVYPRPNELFVDIDSKEHRAIFEKHWSIFGKGENGAARHQSPSPSGAPDHFHIVVVLRRPVKDEAERILLQSLLGSDPMREILSWKRLREGFDKPTFFFEKKTP